MQTAALRDSRSHSTQQKFIPIMHALADASAAWIMRYFRGALVTELKSDYTPVTEADRGAERVMREMILAAHPDHGIIGEEYGNTRADARWTWVLDPIDGTKSFISGVPLFGTLIALCEDGEPVLGCINLPALGQRFLGDGSHAWLNGTRIHMRPVASISEATLLVTDAADVKRCKSGENFERLVDSVRMYRSWGDCYGHSLLASGYADIMVDPILQPWDIMALLPILRGAGAVVSNFEGGDPLSSNSLVAAHPSLHAEVIELLNKS